MTKKYSEFTVKSPPLVADSIVGIDSAAVPSGQKNIAIPLSNFALLGVDNPTGNLTLGSGNVGIGIALPTEKLDVVGNAKISANLNVGNDSLFVDSVTKTVHINGTGVVSDFSIHQNVTQSRRGILLTGNGYFGGTAPGDGVFISNILNSVGNMQIGIGQFSDFGNATKNIFRYSVGFPVPNIGGVSGDGTTNTHISFGNQVSNIGIGFNPLTVTQANLALAKVYIQTGTTTTAGLIIQGIAGQSADLLQIRNSTGSVRTKIDFNGNLDMLAKNISNAVIVTPTIASFVNAGHNHQDAAGGGTLLSTAALSDTANIAYLNTLNTFSDNLQQFTDNTLQILSPDNTKPITFVNSQQITNRNLTIPVLNGNDSIATLGVGNVFSVDQRISGSAKLIFGDDTDTFIHQSFNNILTFATANITRLTLRAEGVVIGDSSTTTNRTGNFLHIPTTAGTPNGTPSLITNRVPMVYDSTNHELFIHDGTFWESVDHTYSRRIKPIDQIVNNSTTIQNDNDMVIALRSGKTYSGEVILFLNSPVTPGFKYDFLFGGTFEAGTAEYGSGTASSTVPVSTVAMSTVTVLTTDGTNQKITIQFRIKTTAAANLLFRWAQNVATAVDTKALTGSRMVVWEER